LNKMERFQIGTEDIMKYINSLIAITGWFLIVIAITAVSPALTQAQKPGAAPTPPVLDVKVVNSASEPVPVTGTVNVGNLGATPLPVRDVGISARQPVQFKELFIVPAGKRLVIEYISAEIRNTTGPWQYATVRLTSISPARLYYFYPSYVGTLPTPTVPDYVYGISQETKVYIDENKHVLLSLITAGGCDISTTTFISASGFLVDMQ